jgi:hypothetical protein
MDLEHELREAMAEHVGGVSASETLAQDARRRHHRTVRVRTLAVCAAAAAVVLAAGMPAYQAFRPEPVGAPARTPGGAPAGGPGLTSQQPVQKTLPAESRTTSAEPPDGTAPAPARSPRRDGGLLGRSFLTYLPPGLRQTGPCATTRDGNRRTTSCRWSGPAGVIELELVRGSALGGPADLGSMTSLASPARVHDQPALRGDLVPGGSQVAWIERPDVGVWLGVGASLNEQLMRIAEGVRVPS